ncbi:MAG: ribosome biogenesis GTPase Der [Planctomycetes bacterium]|nr:ribosome biogenesis GTPase Der [Planctomycetota bacterium]
MLPVVAIVGRPNVGKSSFLNAALGRRVSIVHDKPGVTRDRVQADLAYGERAFTLVDMGGIGIVDDHALDDQVEMQINVALTASDVVIFIVDVRDGVTPLDEQIAGVLRRVGKPCVLVANKVDAEQHESLVHEFASLGLGDAIPVSAKQELGIWVTLDAAIARLPEAKPGERVAEEGETRIAFVGQRNSGKSTLLNALCGEDRVIVSDIPGTTRDSVDVSVEFGDRMFTAIDTAGIRKVRKLQDSIEYYSQIRAHESIGRADVVLHLIDATKDVSQVDKKIADAVATAVKPCVLAINKWDLAEHVETEKYLAYLSSRLPFWHFAPVVFVSAKEQTRLKEMMDVAFDLHDQGSHRIPTPEVNKVMEAAARVRGPRVSRGKYPKIYYATQVGTNPPWIVLFVNDPALFKDDFRRFLENRFRAAFPFEEIPIRISFRKRKSIFR